MIETPGDRLSFYFPFFLPEIALSQGPEATSLPSGPYYHLDAALIFKALGDATLYAIASITAKEPTSSVLLAQKLSLTRATVSHHVRVLREADLLDETRSAGSVLLTLRRSVIDQIPRFARRQLFG